jgi:hypothetical protein
MTYPYWNFFLKPFTYSKVIIAWLLVLTFLRVKK